jgi:DNA polymerase-3 subunit delta'
MTNGGYPWHRPAWTQAWAAVSRGAHALLIAGMQGLGKSQFADAFALAHLCKNGSEAQGACGKCESCHWISAGTHPDLIVVEPLVDDDAEAAAVAGSGRSKPISVDQIRNMTESLGLTAHRAAGKVVIVRPADALNMAASNALLKSLEEPPTSVLFLLVSDRPAWLLPTVRSRCQRVSVDLRDVSQASEWLRELAIAQPELNLALSGGAPLLAQRIATDPVWQRRADVLLALLDVEVDPIRVAERYRDALPATVLGWLQKLTYDLMSVRSCGRVRYHIDLQTEIEECAQRADPIVIGRLHRKLVSTQRIANHPLNARLFLEQLFIDFAVAFEGNNAPLQTAGMNP